MPEKKSIEIPPRGTRGTQMPFSGVLMRVAKPLTDMQISRYRRAKDATAPKMMGFPTVLLTTVGARTGHERTHVLGGFPDGEDAWLVVASKDGTPVPRPDMADPRVAEVFAALRRFVAEHGSIPTAESWTEAAMRSSEKTIRRRFGSFKVAVATAMIDPE